MTGTRTDRQEAVADRLERFVTAKARLAAEHPLRYLFWEATLRCNLACRHCGSDCLRDNSSRDRELPPEAIKRELAAIAQACDPRHVTLAIIGGEPLIRRDIEEVGAFAAGLGYGWGITTNAMLLDGARLASLKTAGLSTISVSLDGLEPDHDALRRRDGAFRQVSAALERLVADPFYTAFDVICCVSRLNVDRLEPFVDHLAGLGVPQVRFTPVFSRGRAGRESGLMLSGGQYRDLLAFIARARQERNDITVTLSEEGYWGPDWECRVRDGLHYCGSGTVIATILHDGGVTGCPSVSRRFTEGSIRQSAFLDVWRDGFGRFRQERRAAAPQACGACDHWDLCEGGGFHLFDPEDPQTVHCGLRKIGDMGECDD
ncbi:radical SAM protein [Paramagnetospirillum magneticum]|uniref:Coenzyme PQQ synthesis protein E n=1 Tax=Paramagnetospirillum magneticum (strain ATCC 700264 / AMB-1) TaxID=342108 RepID=Q2W2X9_PARM1|nr:radical SAM protein [Paramagnetospirillum magneticum]BAE51796.1 Coenzyme PQQ synthesis protein E [Paramagnetospirillum magneticum AMB-1]